MKTFESVLNGSQVQWIKCIHGGVLPYKVIDDNLPFKTLIQGLSSIDITIATLSFCLNFLLLVTIIRTKVLRVKRFYQGLIFMIVSDLCTGLFSQGLQVKHFFLITSQDQSPQYNCTLYLVLLEVSSLFGAVSFSALAFLTTERYVSVCYATRYTEIITRARAICACLALGFLSLAITIFRLFYYHIVNVVIAVIVCLEVITITSMYYWILKTIKQSHRATATVQSTIEQSKYLRSLAREARLAKRFIVLIIILYICFIPYSVVMYLSKTKEQSLDWKIAHYLTISLLFLNALVNPSLMLWQDSILRKHVVNVLKRSERRVEVEHTDTGSAVVQDIQITQMTK